MSVSERMHRISRSFLNFLSGFVGLGLSFYWIVTGWFPWRIETVEQYRGKEALNNVGRFFGLTNRGYYYVYDTSDPARRLL